jgi:hypothetical protein
MGFFGGGGNGGGQRSESDGLIDQQFKQNQAELEQKRKNLYQERLDIIKGQGGQTWTPKR